VTSRYELALYIEYTELIDELSAKVIFMTLGPHVTWEYIQKISATIPTLRKLKDHIEAEVNHFRRGKKHSDPDKEEDVALLQASYAASKIHTYTPKRHLHGNNKAQDYLAKGSNPETLRKVVGNWIKK
jgi:hypothetical protein